MNNITTYFKKINKDYTLITSFDSEPEPGYTLKPGEVVVYENPDPESNEPSKCKVGDGNKTWGELEWFSDVSSVTASAGTVLSGCSIVDKNGILVEGTIGAGTVTISDTHLSIASLDTSLTSDAINLTESTTKPKSGPYITVNSSAIASSSGIEVTTTEGLILNNILTKNINSTADSDTKYYKITPNAYINLNTPTVDAFGTITAKYSNTAGYIASDSDSSTASLGFDPKICIYSVEKISDAPYGFAKNSKRHWESQNKGIDSSYAICRVNIIVEEPSTVVFEIYDGGESNYDYGIFSALDSALTLSDAADSSGVHASLRNKSSSDPQYVIYKITTAGTHFVDVKFRKEVSASTSPDKLSFTIANGIERDTTNTVISLGYDSEKSITLATPKAAGSIITATSDINTIYKKIGDASTCNYYPVSTSLYNEIATICGGSISLHDSNTTLRIKGIKKPTMIVFHWAYSVQGHGVSQSAPGWISGVLPLVFDPAASLSVSAGIGATNNTSWRSSFQGMGDGSSIQYSLGTSKGEHYFNSANPSAGIPAGISYSLNGLMLYNNAYEGGGSMSYLDFLRNGLYLAVEVFISERY